MKGIVRVFLVIAILFFGTTENAAPEETPTERTQASEVQEYGSWRGAYADFVKETEYGESSTYALIYVNNDNIPELVMDSGVEAGGCVIVTYDQGETDVLQTSRLYFDYIEKGNMLCNSDENMGYYYDVVYKIKDGKWEKVAEGNYHDAGDEPEMDAEGAYIYEYEWNGRPVSEKEYYRNLSDIYNLADAVNPDIYYIKDEMLSYLETGHCTSADHSYELITEDVTWSEAREICEEKGGYLATITSWEEWDQVTEQIRQEEKTGIQFFVGASKYDEGRRISGGYSWLEKDQTIPWLTYYNVFYGFWLSGEPSYSMTDENGLEIEESCVSLFYRSGDDRFYLNDVPDNILSVVPEYSGRIGYICEYD